LNQEVTAIAKNKLPMEWEYYTNPSKKIQIDDLLQKAASLFANCDSSDAARKSARQEEKKILSEIAKIDALFAERCGCNELY
jgi:hypothetical protein